MSVNQSQTWTLVAHTNSNSFIATTQVASTKLLYRAIAKWLLRGEASELLSACWEHVDQQNNDLEEALLEQLVEQAETVLEDPQTTTVRKRDYAVDITVDPICSNDRTKMFKIDIVPFVYYQSLKKKIRLEDIHIYITAYICSSEKAQTITVTRPAKTPAIQNRSSKLSAGNGVQAQRPLHEK